MKYSIRQPRRTRSGRIGTAIAIQPLSRHGHVGGLPGARSGFEKGHSDTFGAASGVVSTGITFSGVLTTALTAAFRLRVSFAFFAASLRFLAAALAFLVAAAFTAASLNRCGRRRFVSERRVPPPTDEGVGREMNR